MPQNTAPPRLPADIVLLCQALEADLIHLPREAGPGGTVLCAPQPMSVATAQRLFPDRRIEVKTLYAEPDLGPSSGWATWKLLRWMILPEQGGEDAETVRRRVIDTSTRLVGLSKEGQDAVLVAGPVLLRLVAFKLGAIGFKGAFLSSFKPGKRRAFRYQI